MSERNTALGYIISEIFEQFLKDNDLPKIPYSDYVDKILKAV